MAILRDGSAGSLHPFVTDHVAPGATVITDGWQGYRGIDKLGYTHQPRSQRAARARGDDPGELLPGVHRVASLAKRWLLGTHQGSVDETHLQSYLNEFVFRFNRRGSRSRGCCSTACSSSPSATTRCATASSSPTPNRRRHHPDRPGNGAIRPAWTDRRRIGPGERLDLEQSGQLNTPEGRSQRQVLAVGEEWGWTPIDPRPPAHLWRTGSYAKVGGPSRPRPGQRGQQRSRRLLRQTRRWTDDHRQQRIDGRD